MINWNENKKYKFNEEITSKELSPKQLINTYKEKAPNVLSAFYNIRMGEKNFWADKDKVKNVYKENNNLVWNNSKYEEDYIELLDSLDTHFGKTAGAMQFFDIKNNYIFSVRATLSYRPKDIYYDHNFGHSEMILFRECFDDFAKKIDKTEHEITTIEKSIRGLNLGHKDKIFEMSNYLYNNAFEKRNILEKANIIIRSAVEREPCNEEKYKNYNCADFLQKGYTKNSINLHFSSDHESLKKSSEEYCKIYGKYLNIQKKEMDDTQAVLIKTHSGKGNKNHEYQGTYTIMDKHKIIQKKKSKIMEVSNIYKKHNFYEKEGVFYNDKKIIPTVFDITIPKECDSDAIESLSLVGDSNISDNSSDF